jgi:hypothetical protein
MLWYDFGMHHNFLCRPRLNNAASQSDACIWQVGAPVPAALTTESLVLHRYSFHHVVRCHAASNQQQQVELLDREQRGLQFQLERAAARNFREGNYDRITQTVREQVLCETWSNMFRPQTRSTQLSGGRWSFSASFSIRMRTYRTRYLRQPTSPAASRRWRLLKLRMMRRHCSGVRSFWRNSAP